MVPFPAGTSNDIVGRLLTDQLTRKWGQQVIVDIRPGASGNIATEIVAKAPADGYTLLEPAFAHAVNPFLYSKLPFDATKDFAPVLLFASIANVLVIHPSIPANSVKELIAIAKAHPGQVHLTVGAVRYDKDGRARKGVCSTFLAERAPMGVARIGVFVHSNKAFRPPANGDAPMMTSSI